MPAVELPEKPGFKEAWRSLQISEEFVLVLIRPKLGVTERHLADMFSVNKSTVVRVYITWIQFLALTFKESLERLSITFNIERLSMTFTSSGKRQDEISFLPKHGET